MRTFAQFPGDAGVFQTLAHMRGLVNRAQIHPLIRKQAYLATENCPRRNQTCKAYALLGWAQQRIRFVHDPVDYEGLHDPVMIAQAIEYGQQPFGDCDDFSMYVAALAKSIGLIPKFKVVGRDRQFHHVLVSVNGIDLDATRMPWEAPPIPPGRVYVSGI